MAMKPLVRDQVRHASSCLLRMFSFGLTSINAAAGMWQAAALVASVRGDEDGESGGRGGQAAGARGGSAR
eukprot:1203650-Rhodomonas_salina.3